MGVASVLLPYRPDTALPRLRKELNNIYLEALKEMASEYEMSIEFGTEDQKQKLYLVCDFAEDHCG